MNDIVFVSEAAAAAVGGNDIAEPGITLTPTARVNRLRLHPIRDRSRGAGHEWAVLKSITQFE